MQKFAKLFDTKEYGQILIMLDTGEEARPEVRFSFMPKNLGVCSVSLKFKDTENGWDNAEDAFSSFNNEEKAIEAIKSIIETVNAQFTVDI